MAKMNAYDRVKNANQNADLFVKSPYWTPEIEERFQAWRSAQEEGSAEDFLMVCLISGVAVSFKHLDESVCCTLSNLDRREKGQPCLLTGWSDNWVDAILVARFKIQELLSDNWDGVDPGVKIPRR